MECIIVCGCQAQEEENMQRQEPCTIVWERKVDERSSNEVKERTYRVFAYAQVCYVLSNMFSLMSFSTENKIVKRTLETSWFLALTYFVMYLYY